MSTIKILQQVAYNWAVRCFGLSHVQSPTVRVERCVEEMVEAAQSISVPKEVVLKIVEMVYSKKPGDFLQEMGGVSMTLAVLCESQGWNIEDLLVMEINKVHTNPPEYYRNRNKMKVDLLHG